MNTKITGRQDHARFASVSAMREELISLRELHRHEMARFSDARQECSARREMNLYLAKRLGEVTQERDAALARVAALEAQLADHRRPWWRLLMGGILGKAHTTCLLLQTFRRSKQDVNKR